MLKAVKVIKYILMSITVCFLSVLVFAFYTVPDELQGLENEKISVNEIYTLTYDTVESEEVKNPGTGQYKVRVSLFNIPIKNSLLTVNERHYVAISGDIIGLRLFSQGVMIVQIDTIEGQGGTFCPGEAAGLQAGDIIYKIDGEQTYTSSEVNDKIKYSGGNSIDIEYIRNGNHFITTLTPAFSSADNCYKGGLWIRDSAAGIGTLSFYDTKTGVYAALGHAVCDIDTGEQLPLLNGDIVDADVVGCVKSKSGKAGELCGVFHSDVRGIILENGTTGVFGILDEWDSKAKEYPVASMGEIEKGSAQIFSTVDGSGINRYDIEIVKVSKDNAENKHMVIEITDEELLAKTGGIVQGMSGSPIIQNGMLVGVVTHVLVNNPEKGYAISAEYMIKSISEQ